MIKENQRQSYNSASSQSAVVQGETSILPAAWSEEGKGSMLQPAQQTTQAKVPLKTFVIRLGSNWKKLPLL